jgi:putative ABC transport system permease protein
MRPYQLTMRDLAEIRRLADVRAAAPEISRSDLYEVSQWANTSSHVMGTDPTYSAVRNIPLLEGRFIDQNDVNDRRLVAVLGSKTANLLFPGHPRLGETITINGTAFRVIGTVDKISRGDFDYDDRKIYLPISTMLQLFPLKGDNVPEDALSSIQYQPAHKGEVIPAKAAVHRVIAKNHGFDPSMTDAFQEWDTVTEMKMVGAIFTAMDIFLGGVGIVTLGLGAVGIINIMLVSVTERTSEIGLRKALGATKRSILTQFFWEGLLLTGVSGAIGIGASALFMGALQALLMGKMPGWDPPRLVPWSAAVAMLSLVISGVAAGLYPASKAAQLDPVEALRREN